MIIHDDLLDIILGTYNMLRNRIYEPLQSSLLEQVWILHGGHCFLPENRYAQGKNCQQGLK